MFIYFRSRYTHNYYFFFTNQNKILLIKIDYTPTNHKVLYVAVTAPVQQRIHGLQSAGCCCHVQDCLAVLQHRYCMTRQDMNNC